MKKLLVYALLFLVIGRPAFADVANQTGPSSENNASQVSAAPAAPKDPSKNVNGLVFTVKTLHIKNGPCYPNGGQMFINIEVKNTTSNPIALNIDEQRGNSIMVNEYGIFWNLDQSNVAGVGVSNNVGASMDYVINPNDTLTAQIAGNVSDCSVTNFGHSFNFQAMFISYTDRGDGKLKRTGVYPVSFLDLHESSVAANAAQNIKDAGRDFWHGLFGK